MKTYFFIFALIFPLLYSNAQSTNTATLTYCPDYYNPFALSQKWRFEYPGKLAPDQVIALSFSVRGINHDKPFILSAQLRKNQTSGDIYLFVQNSTVQCNIRLDVVPGEKTVGSVAFNHNFPAHYTIIRQTWQKILLHADQENSLSGIYEEEEGTTPRPDHDMICEKTTILSLDSNRATATSKPLKLDVQVKFSLLSLSSQTNEPTQDFSGLSDEALAQKKMAVEQKFQNGKGSLTELNAVQREIIRRRQ